MSRPISFKQYLNESKRVLSEDMPIVDYAGQRPPGFEYSTRSTIPEHRGNIGPYQVHHVEDHPDVDGPAFTVHHEGKQVGLFPIVYMGKRSGRNIVTVDMPSLHPAHRGKKAKVRGLASKVYGMIADKFGGVISGHHQTPGSQSLWRNLSKTRRAVVVNDSRAKTTTHYAHNDHPGLKFNSNIFDGYQYAHEDASDTSSRSDTHQRGLERMRNRLKEGGMDSRKLGKFKTLADFPHPDTFKRVKTKMPAIKRYNPDVHEPIVYSDEHGADMRILVLGNRKKKKTK